MILPTSYVIGIVYCINKFSGCCSIRPSYVCVYFKRIRVRSCLFLSAFVCACFDEFYVYNDMFRWVPSLFTRVGNIAARWYINVPAVTGVFVFKTSWRTAIRARSVRGVRRDMLPGFEGNRFFQETPHKKKRLSKMLDIRSIHDILFPNKISILGELYIQVNDDSIRLQWHRGGRWDHVIR